VFFVIFALEKIAALIVSLLKSRKKALYQEIVILTSALVIILLNLSIFGDFVEKGLREGDDIGSTGRYISNIKLPGHHFYLIASENNKFYQWGNETGALDRMTFFATTDQTVTLIDPKSTNGAEFSKPGTIFINRPLWEQEKTNLENKIGNYSLTKLKEDGSLLAIEFN
jgi:hypothetical protein